MLRVKGQLNLVLSNVPNTQELTESAGCCLAEDWLRSSRILISRFLCLMRLHIRWWDLKA